MISPFHAKYYAYALTLRRGTSNVERITQSLFDATVDLNPHQIEAAHLLYESRPLKTPLKKGLFWPTRLGLARPLRQDWC